MKTFKEIRETDEQIKAKMAKMKGLLSKPKLDVKGKLKKVLGKLPGADAAKKLAEEPIQEDMIQDFEIRFGKESDWKKATKMVTDYLKKDAPKHAKALLTKYHVIGPDPMMVAVGDTNQKLKPPVNLNKLYNAIRKLPSSRMKYWQAIPKKQEKDALGEGKMVWNHKPTISDGTMQMGIFDSDREKAEEAARQLIFFLRKNKKTKIGKADPEKNDSNDTIAKYSEELSKLIFDDKMLDDLEPNGNNENQSANDIVLGRLRDLGVRIK